MSTLHRLVGCWVFVCAIVAPAMERSRAAAADETPSDETRPEGALDWTLGPTGLRGWIRSADGHTGNARKILVTAVAAGSPADGVVNVGDVIAGVDGKPFSADARIQFARAIAEAEAADGTLRLLRSRNGKSETIALRLAVLGAYASTAPYDCPKSKRIFELGCAALAERMSEPNYARRLDPIPRSLNALALLASGNRDYLPLVKREATWAAGFTSDGFLSWYYGYLTTFLGEYVAVTNDLSVLPGLRRLALETARGRSGVGTWGHRFALPTGNLSGYGAMNQPGLSLTIGMVLAREAGVDEPEIDRAIAQSAAFLRWFVDKGAVPYGDHQPFPAHEDNGKCSAGAVLFDLLADREAAEFFGKMAVAAYSERERGHTGNYFNYLWAMPGVARCGPAAAAAYWKEQSWYYDFARTWDARWEYQGSPDGAEEYRAYVGWDCSGGLLLTYALPLRSLRLTGKKPSVVPALSVDEAAEVIAAGRDFAYRNDDKPYERRSTEQLLAGLSSWSPFVRRRSAAALARRDGDLLPTLVKLLADANPAGRYGAIEALGALGPRADAAAAQLRTALRDRDLWVQCLAAEALASLGPDERRASVGDLLSLTVRRNPADPRGMAARSAGVALFAPYPGRSEPRSILAESLAGVDRELLVPAIRTMLQHEDSVVRGSLRRAYAHLTDQDLVQLLPDIVRAVERIAPSNEMFADGVVLAGLDLLSRLRVREGMALCVSAIEPDRWGERNRTKVCLSYLRRYGAHAKPLLPKLKEIRKYLAEVKRLPAPSLAEFDSTLAAIESDADAPTLVGLAEFRTRSIIDDKMP